MEDLGEPISYLTLSKGAAVYSSDGEHLGRVSRVLADLDSDVFDGLVFDVNGAMPGGQHFVDAPEVDRIFERGVVLKIDAAEAGELPAPSANPGSLSIKPGDLGRGGGAMRRLWDRLSGKG